MPLEMRKYPNGSLRSQWWYGRYEVDGKRYCDNLGVKIAGEPPPNFSLKENGDPQFERSRALALAKLASIIEDTRTRHDAKRLVEKMYEIKTGEVFHSVAIADLPEEWLKLPRRRKLNKVYANQCRTTLGRFIEFMHRRHAKVLDLAHVNRAIAREFLDSEAERGVATKTWNSYLILMRTTCKFLLPDGCINPFAGIPSREEDTIFRKPYTPEELAAILEAAKDDEFVRPIMVTAICTAMRLGDCCQLKWKDVDLPGRFINVKTSKTGQAVSIPIFPLLADELARRKPKGDLVFPEQAEVYRSNSSGISTRFKKVLVKAGFKKGDEDEKNAGKRGEIYATRQQGGLRRASIRDFHSFRVTWVTLALTAGVPLELVIKVTGHQTTNIVLKHYFQPGREDFRRTLQVAMPKLLTNGSKTPLEEAREIVGRMTVETWERDQLRLKVLLAQC